MKNENMNWCIKISDLGIDLLCKKCKDLKSLDVSYLKITNDSILSIALLPKLEVLHMEIDVTRCERVSLSSLVSIVRGHPGIQHLKASHCVSVSLRLGNLCELLTEHQSFGASQDSVDRWSSCL